jgi:hypothetical protein
MPTIIETQLAIIAERRQQWEIALWQAEKVDLPIAHRLEDKQMKAQSLAGIKRCQTALALLDELQKEVEDDNESSTAD